MCIPRMCTSSGDFGPSWGANTSFPVLDGVDVVEFFVANVRFRVGWGGAGGNLPPTPQNMMK